MRDVVIIGVGMHPFGKFLEKSIKEMASTAIWNAIEDAGVRPQDIQLACFGNSMAGLITGMESVRGQTVLRDAGFGGIPVVNVENACATGGTALREAWIEVGLGLADVALVVGVEKMFLADTAASLKALSANASPELARMGYQFSASYAMRLKEYMTNYGWTQKHLAMVAAKNSYNGSLNPFAQHRKALSVEEVLASRVVVYPLTLYMCASMADGAAAAIICSREKARKFSSKPPIHIAAIALRSGMWRHPQDKTTPSTVTMSARQAYEMAGIGPEDIDLAEVHDAMAPAELIQYEDLLFCKKGEAARLIEEERTKVTGDIPVNTSGGLTSRGHPIGATGVAQVSEIVWQLRGEAGGRQVKDPKVGLVQNAGGRVEDDIAACCCIVLKK